MNGFWETTRTLSTEDVDMNGLWRASGIFRAMQEAASAQCEPQGLGLAAMRAQGLAWVLTRARLSISRLPEIGQTVTVRTWPKPPQHLFFPRFFRFSVDGAEAGTASALYVQLDTRTRRMARPWINGHTELTCDAEPALPPPGGIPALDAPVRTLAREAVYSDLDINGHVNNARYLDWLCDCFDSAHHAAWSLQDALIHFSHEVRPQEQVQLALRHTDGQSVLQGAVAGTACFAIGAEWARRQA